MKQQQQQAKDQSKKTESFPQLARKVKTQGRNRRTKGKSRHLSISCPASGRSLSPYSISCRPKSPGPSTPRPATQAAYLSHLHDNGETAVNGQGGQFSSPEERRARSELRTQQIGLRSASRNPMATVYLKSQKRSHPVFRGGNQHSRGHFSSSRPTRRTDAGVRGRTMTVMDGDSAKENHNASNTGNLPSKRTVKKTPTIAAERVPGNSISRIVLPATRSRSAKAASPPAEIVNGECTTMPPPPSYSHSSRNESS